MQTLLFISSAIISTAVCGTITAKYKPNRSPDTESRAFNVATGAIVSFNWTVDVPPGGRIIAVTWLFERYGQNNVTLASLVNDQFYPRLDNAHMIFLPNVGIQLSHVTPEHSGHYFVIAQWASDDGQGVTSFENGSSLTVSDPLTVIHRCHDDWVHFDDSCYAFLDDIAPWSTAVEMCRKLHSSLLVITNDKENDFIAAQLRTRHGTSGNNWYWININDFLREGRWVHGQDETPLAFNRWAAGQPNNGMAHENGEDCAVILSDGTWHDLWCQEYPRASYMPRPVCKMSVMTLAEHE